MSSDADGGSESDRETESVGGDGASDDAARSFPECPRCGEPFAFAHITGPDTGSVGPCGCSVPPDLIVRARRE